MKNFFSRVWKFLKSKLFIVILLTTIIIVGTTVAIVLLVTRTDGMTIRALAGNDITQRQAWEYKNSRLHLYDNETFTVSIIYNEVKELTGIGTYKKEGSNYIFHYLDMWWYDAMLMKYRQVTKSDMFYDDFFVKGMTYPTNQSGQIEVRCPNLRSHFFK